MRLKYLLALISLVLIIGCNSPEKKSGNTNANVNNVQIVADVRAVTTDQLKRVSSEMNYEEVTAVLGNSEDIGSGRYIKKYQLTGDREFTLNFGDYKDLISSYDFKQIQNLIAP
jgi:hypothetical protein